MNDTATMRINQPPKDHTVLQQKTVQATNDRSYVFMGRTRKANIASCLFPAI